MAAAAHHPEAVIVLLQNNADVNKTTEQNCSAIIYASQAKQANPDVVLQLIKTGAYLDYAEKEGGYTALMTACDNNPQIAQLLIEAGANVNLYTRNGTNALMHTTSYNPYLITFLIEAGANVNEVYKNGDSPLIYAAYHNPELIDFLIRYGADVNLIQDQQQGRNGTNGNLL